MIDPRWDFIIILGLQQWWNIEEFLEVVEANDMEGGPL